MTLHKRKDRVVTEDKNNIFYEIDCSNSQAVYFGEPKIGFRRTQKISQDLRL